MKTTGIDTEAQRVLRMENQWSQTFIMWKTAPGGCAFTALAQVDEF